MSDDAMAFLCELFLQHLPPNVQMVLSSSDSTMDLCKLADMEDKVIEAAVPSVSAISDIPADALGVKLVH